MPFWPFVLFEGTLAATLPAYVVAISGYLAIVKNAQQQEEYMDLTQIIGFVAGFGTTFAALPDLIAMLRRRSGVGMNPRMAAILGTFQILWVIYGLSVGSRNIVMWNIIAIVINYLTVGAYFYFARAEKRKRALQT